MEAAEGAPAGIRAASDDGGARKSALRLLLSRIGVLALLIAAWQAASIIWDADLWIGRPSTIAHTLGTWTSNGYLWHNLRATLYEMLIGFLVGAAAGIVLGVILGLLPYLGRVLDPFIAAFYSLPKIALAPLFVLWFGIGLEMKVILIAVTVLFLVFSNTYAGVRARDHELIEVLQVMGASRWDIIRKVVMPGSFEHIFVGLKLGIPYSLVGAIFGEIVASNKGIGYVLMFASGQFDTDGLMAALVILMILGAVMNGLLIASEKHVMRWRNIQRK